MVDFDHPNIIKLFQVLESQKNIYLIMEYAKNGDLLNFMNKTKNVSESGKIDY